eukprot:gene14694-biopygen11344
MASVEVTDPASFGTRRAQTKAGRGFWQMEPERKLAGGWSPARFPPVFPQQASAGSFPDSPRCTRTAPVVPNPSACHDSRSISVWANFSAFEPEGMVAGGGPMGGEMSVSRNQQKRGDIQHAGQLDLAWRLPAASGPDCVPLRSLRKPFVIGEHLILAQQPALSRGTAPVFSRCVPVLPLPARAHAAKCAPELRKLAQQGTNGVVGRTRAHLLQLGGTLSTLRRALGGALRLRRRELGGRRG